MTFTQFLGILRARIWVFLATLGITVATTAVVTTLLPSQYSATTTLVVDSKGADPVFGVMLPPQMMPGYLATQIDIIQSHRVAVEVVRALGAAQNQFVRQQWLDETGGKGTVEDWFADSLLKKLDVKPSRESNVIEITYSGRDPRLAAAVADAFAVAYQRTALELRVEPAKLSASFFDDRLKQLRKNLEEAQAKLNEYQREKGFTAQDERLDLETSRLNELSAQYTQAQASAADAESRLRQLNEFLSRGASPETIPDVLGNGLIQNLKSQLTVTEARLQQTSSQLGANHPEVKRLEADIASQRAKLKAELSVAASGVANAAKIAQKREADLAGQLAAQKSRLLKGNQGRDQLQVLMKEVESAQRAYDTAAQRFQQTNLESQSVQNSVSILTKAVAPIEPSFPKPVLNIFLSVLLGTLLGAGVVILLELMNRRIRSTDDLTAALNAPVLGVMLDDKAARKPGARWSRGKRDKRPVPPKTGAAVGS